MSFIQVFGVDVDVNVGVGVSVSDFVIGGVYGGGGVRDCSGSCGYCILGVIIDVA